MSLIVPLNANLTSLPFCPALDGEAVCSKLGECAMAALWSLRGEKPVMTMERMLEERPRLSDDASLIRFIQSNKNVEFPNELKHLIILGAFSSNRLSDETVQFLIKELRLEISYPAFIGLLQKYGYAFIRPILDTFIDLYKTSSPAQDFDILEYLFLVSKNGEFLRFWNQHSQYFMNEKTLQIALQGWAPSSLNVAKWLQNQGVPSSWFNTPNAMGQTLLQRIAGRGDMELFNRIAKDIPKEQIQLGAFKEEMEDCLIQSEPVDLSQFDRKGLMFGQNGCRAVVMTDEGEVYSYPGQDAAQLAQQMDKSMDSFTIYHNPGHASIAFKDAHFGFYPFNAQDKENIAVNEAVAALNRHGQQVVAPKFSTISGAILGMEPGVSSSTHSYKSKAAALAPLVSSGIRGVVTSYENKPCMVIDDSSQKALSDATNGLALTVYASKDRVEAVRQYVMLVQKSCQTGDRALAYHALSYNCIDFVRQAVQACGSKADFRDSFHTMQYFRRPGVANLWTLFRSNQPKIQSNQSTLVDRVSRNGVLGAMSAPFVYQMYKGASYATAAAARLVLRIQRFAFTRLFPFI
jgi:hypothetical protein